MAHRKAVHHIPERFLRQLWQHRKFQTSNLSTTDGQSVEILFPGIFNRDGGPDFLNGQIRIDGILYRGDVELHQHTTEWTQHRHDQDPKYNSVILHVVLSDFPSRLTTRAESKRSIPVLELRHYLLPSHHARWHDMIHHEREERSRTIRCFTMNDNVSPEVILEWIQKLALERIEVKIRRYEERLRELVEEQRLTVSEYSPRYHSIRFGLNPDELPPPLTPLTQTDYKDSHPWRQLLYEGIMEAFGYSKNQKPFLKLARNMTLRQMQLCLPAPYDHNNGLEALLFGSAGLLPNIKDVKRKTNRSYVSPLKRLWKTLKPNYHRAVLNKAEWQFFCLRPENFPTARIAGVSQLVPKLLEPEYLRSIIHVVRDGGRNARKRHSMLRDMFIVPATGFWKTHYRFEEPASREITNLIGASRANDIILNVVIPLCFLYARIFKDKFLREETMALFKDAPSASSNAATREIEAQLIKGKFRLDSALFQQGALHLYKLFCLSGRCMECSIGKIVFASDVGEGKICL